MKNLIKKTILISGLAGIVSSCGRTPEPLPEQEPVIWNQFRPDSLHKVLTELEKFNKENKKIYDDFTSFVKKKGKVENECALFYKCSLNDKEITAILSNDSCAFHRGPTKRIDLSIHNRKSGERVRRYCDKNANGLDLDDVYNPTPIARGAKYLENYGFFVKRQLGISKDYTTFLKQIMHNAKYKQY